LIKPIASGSRNSTANAADDTADADPATVASDSHIDEHSATTIEPEHSDTIDVTTEESDDTDTLADEGLDATGSADAAISAETAGETVREDNASAASPADLTGEGGTPQESAASPASVEDKN